MLENANASSHMKLSFHEKVFLNTVDSFYSSIKSTGMCIGVEEMNRFPLTRQEESYLKMLKQIQNKIQVKENNIKRCV